MSTTVYLGQTKELADIAGRGAAHPVFGSLFDLGTVAAFTGAGDQADRAVEDLCRSVDPDGRALTVVRLPASFADDDRELRQRLEREAAAGAVCVVLVDAGDSGLPPLVLVCGAHLPAMGVVADCDPARLRATLAQLAGAADPDAESLFTEAEVPSSIMEEQLNERLKQLYGE